MSLICKDMQDFETFCFEDLEFFAGDELILINPTVRMTEDLIFFSGRYGPLTSGKTVAVPLWLALKLKKMNECIIIPPREFTVSNLEDVLEKERLEADSLQPLSFYFEIIGQLLFSVAMEDFREGQRIFELFNEIVRFRRGKVERELKKINKEVFLIQLLPNIGASEIALHRSFITRSLEMFDQMGVDRFPQASSPSLNSPSSFPSSSLASSSFSPRSDIIQSSSASSSSTTAITTTTTALSSPPSLFSPRDKFSPSSSFKKSPSTSYLSSSPSSHSSSSPSSSSSSSFSSSSSSSSSLSSTPSPSSTPPSFIRPNISKKK